MENEDENRVEEYVPDSPFEKSPGVKPGSNKEEVKIYKPAKVEAYEPKVENSGVIKESPEKHVQPTTGAHVQVYDIITGKDPSWQGIIYDLISSEQLDPWNVDIGRLCQGYFEKIKVLEENDFFVSSKMLLTASLLLRIKSEILMNKYMKDIDEVLFGRKEEEKRIFERIEIDEDNLPILSPKSPLPRYKKVTLDELMGALDIAIQTESRRIHKVIEKKQRERLVYVDVPEHKRIDIRSRMRKFYAQVLSSFNNPKHNSKLKLPYTHFTNNNRDEKIACFLPMLQLSNNKKLWLEQSGHFEEIYLYLFQTFKKNFPDHDNEIEEMAEELMENIKEAAEQLDDEHQKRVEEINKDFDNPIGDMISGE